jgi:hypothetical protein
VAQGGLVSPVLFSLYLNDMTAPFRHVELAMYADDMALIATFRSPLLLVSYLETYPGARRPCNGCKRRLHLKIK